MSREQLEKFALNLRNEVEREREERNYFQLERDQLRQFWEITKNQLGELLIEPNGLLNSIRFRLNPIRFHSGTSVGRT